jgi:hypothetical protein
MLQMVPTEQPMETIAQASPARSLHSTEVQQLAVAA